MRNFLTLCALALVGAASAQTPTTNAVAAFSRQNGAQYVMTDLSATITSSTAVPRSLQYRGLQVPVRDDIQVSAPLARAEIGARGLGIRSDGTIVTSTSLAAFSATSPTLQQVMNSGNTTTRPYFGSGQIYSTKDIASSATVRAAEGRISGSLYVTGDASIGGEVGGSTANIGSDIQSQAGDIYTPNDMFAYGFYADQAMGLGTIDKSGAVEPYGAMLISLDTNGVLISHNGGSPAFRMVRVANPLTVTGHLWSTGAISTSTSLNAATLALSGNASIGGTVTAGTWNGTKISEVYGGTNQNSYTTGDILYASAANTLSKRAIGSSGDVLTVSGGIPTWVAPGSITESDTLQTVMNRGRTTTIPFLSTAEVYAQKDIATSTTLRAAAGVVSGDVTAGTFTGNGAALTNLNATNLASGTVPDARIDIPGVTLTTGKFWYGSGGVAAETTNLPVANLNGGSGASSSTFWRGDGTWATASAAEVDTLAAVTGRGASTAVASTFSGGLSATGSGTGLDVTNNAWIKDVLTVGDHTVVRQANVVIDGNQVIGSTHYYHGLAIQDAGSEDWFVGLDGTSAASKDFILRAASTNDWFRMLRSTGSAAFADRLAVGTATPASSGDKLQVTGNANVSGTVTAATLAGSGSGLTAASVPDSALSSNIPLKNGTNTFTAAQTISGASVSDMGLSVRNTAAAQRGGIKLDGVTGSHVLYYINNALTYAMYVDSSGFNVYDYNKPGNVWQMASATGNMGVAGRLGVNNASAPSTGAYLQTPSIKVSVVSKTGAYTMTDAETTCYGDASGGGFTVTLPTAVGRAGQRFTVVNTAATGTVTVGTTSSQNINGATTLALAAQYKSTTVESNGTQWYIIAQGI